MIYKFVSKETPTAFELEDGIYTLTEISAPENYEIAETITFTDKDGKVDGGKVVMQDRPIKGKPVETPKVVISKVDATTSKELPGATLQIHKGDKLVEEWVSTNKPHEVAFEDGTYTLTEITAPAGYLIAEKITFTVSGGKVTGGKVVMKDKPVLEVKKSEPQKKPTDSTTMRLNVQNEEVKMNLPLACEAWQWYLRALCLRAAHLGRHKPAIRFRNTFFE